jgi:hypothetical protein
VLKFILQPLGTVTNTPTKGVKCLDATGRLKQISLANIKIALKLAQEGPLQTGINKNLFPHVFSNFNNVRRISTSCWEAVS